MIFFIPKKDNFHPNDIIDDLKLIGGDIFYFDGDTRDYNHEIEEKEKLYMKIRDIFQ